MWLRGADAHPGAGLAHRAGGPGLRGRGEDGQRQDVRLPDAGVREDRGERLGVQAQAQARRAGLADGPGARPHPRARPADRGGGREVRARGRRPLRRRLRWCAQEGPSSRAEGQVPRRRHRHTRPARGPLRRVLRGAGAGADGAIARAGACELPRLGRGGPDARHGLRAGHPQDRCQVSAQRQAGAGRGSRWSGGRLRPADHLLHGHLAQGRAADGRVHHEHGCCASSYWPMR
mmetsp:Transcript_125421/g.304584  ORF Transcript_125421/g.304584 Transcript_125421/m.304584 type:complete len:233 (-) Transcript_125421:1776-2474(-)